MKKTSILVTSDWFTASLATDSSVLALGTKKVQTLQTQLEEEEQHQFFRSIV